MSKTNFNNFLSTQVSIPVISGIFTYKLLSSISDNIVSPVLAIMIDKNDFSVFDISIDDYNNIVLRTPVEISGSIKHSINVGVVLREFIIWLLIMILLYQIHK